MKKTPTERNARPQPKPSTTTSATSAAPPTPNAPAATTSSAASSSPPEEAPVGAAPSEVPEVGKSGGSVQVVTRFPAELAALVDRYTERLRSERLGLRVSRADAVRILVNERLVELETAREWPGIVKHDGRTYFRTGKLGTSRATGAPVAEYEDEDRARVWRDATGAVRPE